MATEKKSGAGSGTDETTPLPVTETPSADETVVLPVTEAPAADDTSVLPVTDTQSADDTTVLPITEAPADDAAAVIEVAAADEAPVVQATPTDETAALPVTEDPRVAATEPVGSPQPAAYTSPIGALYAPPATAGYAPTNPTDAYVPSDDAPVVQPAPVDPPRRRLRVGTVVWGLVIAAIGVGLLAWAAGVAIDLQLAMILLLAVAGTALLVGSIVSGARAARR